MRRFAWICGCLALGSGCTALLDTASLDSRSSDPSVAEDASPDAAAGEESVPNSSKDASVDKAIVDVAPQCQSAAGPQAACISKNCCSYILTCDADPSCQLALTAYDQCTASAKADSVKRAACAAAFRNAGDGKANEVLNCENLYRDVCNDV
jgi:hypothetical protein